MALLILVLASSRGFIPRFERYLLTSPLATATSVPWASQSANLRMELLVAWSKSNCDKARVWVLGSAANVPTKYRVPVVLNRPPGVFEALNLMTATIWLPLP